MTAMAGKKSSFQESRLLPFDTIKAAVSGDEKALTDVVRHYDRMITALATETVQDTDGVTHTQINDELKTRIQNKLIEGVTMRFHLRRDTQT